MQINKLFTFLFSSTIYWFLCGGPNFFSHPTSLGFYALGLIYITCMLWSDSLYSLFDGDVYTYGSATRGMSLFFGLPALIVLALLIRVDSNLFSVPQWISNIGIGFILLGLLTIISIPIMSTNNVDSLPDQKSRRSYEDGSVVSRKED